MTQATSPYMLTTVICQQQSEEGFNGYATYLKNEKDVWVRIDR